MYPWNHLLTDHLVDESDRECTATITQSDDTSFSSISSSSQKPSNMTAQREFAWLIPEVSCMDARNALYSYTPHTTSLFHPVHRICLRFSSHHLQFLFNIFPGGTGKGKHPMYDKRITIDRINFSMAGIGQAAEPATFGKNTENIRM